MILQTRTKVTLARFAAYVIVALRRLAGLGPFTQVKRDGFAWDLNLMDGIDFSIYLLGSFEPKTQTAFKKLCYLSFKRNRTSLVAPDFQ